MRNMPTTVPLIGYSVLPVITSVMAEPYPELAAAKNSIATTLRAEEERFLDTLETGLQILE
ncbi:MAG: hypothetical protein B7Z80_19650, partial [Rhodospirillales bacterium 20-64-7]